MKIYKKISFVLTTIIILFFLISNVISFGKTPETFKIGMLQQNMFNALNITLESNDGTNKVEQKYKDFIEYPNDDLFQNVDERSCIVGGQYLLQVLSWPPSGAGKFNRTVNLFYCKTTQDLINQIKIPSSWITDNLILYCNDGLQINSQVSNFDFLTSNLDTYKACILKNLDTGNTTLYGLEVGNSAVDSNETFFFNTTTNLSRIISESKFEFVDGNGEGNYIFKDTEDKKNYYFKYNNISKFYSLSDTNDSFDTNLNTIFTRDIGISRIALHRQINGNQTYGYESATSTIRNPTIITPIYKIFYQNAITLSADQCVNSLKKYGATTGTLGANDKILCKNNLIEIYSDRIDGNKYGDTSEGSGGSVTSFNIFKNIILGLK